MIRASASCAGDGSQARSKKHPVFHSPGTPGSDRATAGLRDDRAVDEPGPGTPSPGASSRRRAPGYPLQDDESTPRTVRRGRRSPRVFKKMGLWFAGAPFTATSARRRGASRSATMSGASTQYHATLFAIVTFVERANWLSRSEAAACKRSWSPENASNKICEWRVVRFSGSSRIAAARSGAALSGRPRAEPKSPARHPARSVVRPRGTTSSNAASASSHCPRSIKTRPRAIGSLPYGIRSSFGPPAVFGGPPRCSSCRGALPGRVVERLDRAVFRVEGQPGEDLYPGGDPIEVVRQFGYLSEQPHP